jgi:hypothetical protein
MSKYGSTTTTEGGTPFFRDGKLICLREESIQALWMGGLDVTGAKKPGGCSFSLDAFFVRKTVKSWNEMCRQTQRCHNRNEETLLLLK